MIIHELRRVFYIRRYYDFINISRLSKQSHGEVDFEKKNYCCMTAGETVKKFNKDDILCQFCKKISSKKILRNCLYFYKTY